jgi:hypothetical protein
LAPHRYFTSFDDNRCSFCEGDKPLVPSRFVIACPRGHIDDFPYQEWVHRGRFDGDASHDLSLRTSGVTASLRDVEISCSCGKQETLDRAFRMNALRGIKRCSGERPWLGSSAVEHCEETPRTVQRGGSNVWFAVPRSALSIPPWSEGAFKALNEWWFIMRAIEPGALKGTIAAMGIADKAGYSVDELVAAVIARKAAQDAGPEGESSIRRDEYKALERGRPELAVAQDFVCVPAEGGSGVSEWFDLVMAVPRLREVRALEGFTRVNGPEPGDNDRMAALFKTDPGWLPAMEVAGEGVFLKLNADRLASWETRVDVAGRGEKIDRNYRRRFADIGKVPDRQITPRFVLLHTLAHLLINQWALECGYPAASLRERIYADDTMAGVLLYTATSDSAGSLGGVVGLATTKRLRPAIEEMLARAAWCSSDPLCGESEGSGVDSLNLAACHACSLLPETSCEETNVLLDRALVLGVPGVLGLGYFLGDD